MVLRTLSVAALAAVLAALAGPAAAAAAHDITIDDAGVFPESLSSTSDGAIYVGSIKGILFRAPPGSPAAEPWIRPSPANGILSILAAPGTGSP